MDIQLQLHLLYIIYLIASVAFILGLKMLSNPKTARNGNLIAAAGMGLAIIATIFFHKDDSGNSIGNIGWIIAGIVIGTVIGVIIARKVKMTAMPQMVSLFNGMGGACAAVIALVEFNHYSSVYDMFGTGSVLVMLLGLLIGSVSFSGSMIAYGKLEGKIGDKILPGQQVINSIFVLAIVAAGAYIMITGEHAVLLFYLILILSLLYGVLFVLPIGGADMPVVISLLNSFTGMAAAFGGFLYDNEVMLTGGILVGSAGTILTILMCKAMNRSLKNVLLGAFGGGAAASGAAGDTDKSINEANSTDVAILCSYARRVVIVPGYGLAVAQAQHTVHTLERILEEKGVEVKYAIHPVAGRMPGHMNVLLAEADVPYDKLVEMEDINPELGQVDVVLVIGANDVVNPAAKNDPSSPIYGMPILEVENSKNVIILKRSMRSGYAGIENELFFYPKTRMLFGDAKDSLEKLIKEVKEI